MARFRMKRWLLALSTGAIALQLFNCARFLGDTVGDAIILGLID